MNKSQDTLLVSRDVVKYTNYYDFTFKSATSNITGYYINNRSSRVLRIERVHFTWPVGACDAVFNIFWQGIVIWNGYSGSSPTTVDSGWQNTPEDREVGKLLGTTKTFEFFWGLTAPATGYTVLITFDNGQTVYIAH